MDRRETDQRAPDSESLLARVVQGDERAFELLYDEVADAVLGLVRRTLRDAAQAEEVAQEVMVEVWRTAARYRPDLGNVRSWVLTLAHRRAVDRVRAEQASTERESRYAARDYQGAFDSVVEAVDSRWEQRRVRHCMSTLTDLQHESVVLTYYRGCTYRQAAELLDTPSSTMKTRLRDGLIRLRDCLGVGR